VDLVRVRLLLVALLALAAGIGIGSHGGGRVGSSAAPQADQLAGIPQHGLELGDPSAPVTLVEFGDLQCPYCAYWSRTTFPVLVRDYVRPGKLKLVFRGLAFLGPDSRKALEAADAAAAQNRLWNVVERLYAKQRSENSGWVTDDLLRSTGAEIDGLDVERMLREAGSPGVRATMIDSAHRADDAHVGGTPSFELGRSAGDVEPFTAASLNPEAFRPALDALLAG
jgi:protein-disulfide isomerase